MNYPWIPVGPEKIKELSKGLGIPVDFVFIGSPKNKFPYKIQELGDVGLIIEGIGYLLQKLWQL